MEPFKEMLNLGAVGSIADAVERVYPAFNKRSFVRNVKTALEPLELKARVQFLTARLVESLPESPAKAFPILVAAVEKNDSLEGFSVWPFTEVVALRGLKHFELSMRTLERLTPHFSAEFAIRPFLKMHREATLGRMFSWTAHKNEHVRRLASEGCRPNLPWGGKIPELLQNPQLTFPILDRLHADPSLYVRLSVANHLNDFSIASPDHVKQSIRRWKDAGSENHSALARRALRTLVKRGDPEALQLLGIEQNGDLQIAGFRLKSRSVAWSGRLDYECTINNLSNTPATVLFDFAMFFRRSNGVFGRKVFRGRKLEVAAHETKQVGGSYSFRPITTRRYYPGEQGIEPILNGRPGSRIPFVLQTPPE
jgi:3-methyladenine DNA glycosylase AlkC